jgi:hypothetical protein
MQDNIMRKKKKPWQLALTFEYNPQSILQVKQKFKKVMEKFTKIGTIYKFYPWGFNLGSPFKTAPTQIEFSICGYEKFGELIF